MMNIRSVVLFSLLGVGCAQSPSGGVRVGAEVDGAGVIISEPGGIFCRAAPDGTRLGVCSATFTTSPTRIHLTATATEGWRFERWEGLEDVEVSGFGGEIAFDPNEVGDLEVRAVFVEPPGSDGGTDGGTATDGGFDAGPLVEDVVLAAGPTGTATNFRSIALFPSGELQSGAAREPQYIFAAGKGEVVLSTDLRQFSSVPTGATGLSGMAVASRERALYISDGQVFSSQDGRTWSPSGSLTQLQSVNAAAHALGQFVVVGATASNGGAILTSTDGATWTQRWSGSSAALSIASDGSRIVVGAAGGVIIRSEDATTWSAGPSGASTGDVIALAIAPSRILALARSSDATETLSSTDGTVWTKQAGDFPAGVTLNALDFAHSYFIAVGSGGGVFTSTDGDAWSRNVPVSDQDLFDVDASGPVIVATGNTGTVGFTYRNQVMSRVDAATPEDIASVAWFPPGVLTGGATRPGQYLLALAGGGVLRSTDAVTFDPVTTGSAGSTALIATSGARALLADGNEIYGSTDGVNWESLATISGVDQAQSLVFGEGVFAFCGSNAAGAGAVLLTSPDGVTWTERARGPQGVFDITYNGKEFFGAMSAGAWLRSPDGVNWDPNLTGATTNPLSSIAASPDLIVAVAQSEEGVETLSYNFAEKTWKKQDASFPDGVGIQGLEYFPPYFMAMGTGGRHFTSFDATSWFENTGSAGTDDILDVTTDGPYIIEVGRNGLIRSIPKW
jgi:hypothetical protein